MRDRNSSDRACRYIEYMLGVQGTQEYDWTGLRLRIDRGVFSPVYSTSSAFFAEHASRVSAGSRVLEFGCGCGIVAIAAARAGAIRVVATEINPGSVACARGNIFRHGCADRVTVVETGGTDFPPEEFDIVFSALPYVFTEDVAPYVRRYGPIAYSMFDEGYEFQRMVMGFVARRAPGATLYLGFGEAGDLDRFYQNAEEFGFRPHEVVREEEDASDNRFYQMVPVSVGPTDRDGVGGGPILVHRREP
jgi:methylase of polypeptide subunit release factors